MLGCNFVIMTWWFGHDFQQWNRLSLFEWMSVEERLDHVMIWQSSASLPFNIHCGEVLRSDLTLIWPDVNVYLECNVSCFGWKCQMHQCRCECSDTHLTVGSQPNRRLPLRVGKRVTADTQYLAWMITWMLFLPLLCVSLSWCFCNDAQSHISTALTVQ